MSATLLYDGDCGFCRWAVDAILRWDRAGAVRAMPLQSPEAVALLPGMDEAQRMASWHLVDGEGRIHSAGAVAAPLAALLPMGAPVAMLARGFPKTTERAYRIVSRNRERLGARLGEAACAVDPSRVTD